MKFNSCYCDESADLTHGAPLWIKALYMFPVVGKSVGIAESASLMAAGQEVPALLSLSSEFQEFNLAVGRRLLQRYLPDVATQALSTCPNYQVASNSQRPSSPSSYTVASTDQRLPVGDPNQGLQAAALESDGSTFPIPSAQQPALDRSNTHSSSPLASSLAQNTPLSMTLPYTSQEPGSAQNGQPSNISSSLSEAYREPGAPAVSAGSSGVPSAYQGQGGRPVRFVGMGGVPMEDQVVDGVWRGALGEEEERRTGVCAKGVMSAVSALLEKLKAISFVEVKIKPFLNQRKRTAFLSSVRHAHVCSHMLMTSARMMMEHEHKHNRAVLVFMHYMFTTCSCSSAHDHALAS